MMATAQHIYRGEGDPYTLGLQAAPGSHFINDLDWSEVWFATGFDDSGEEPYTEWIKLSPSLVPWLTQGGDFFMTEDNWLKTDVIMLGGAFHIDGPGKVYSNVEPVQSEMRRTYQLESAYRLQVELLPEETALVLLTPLSETEVFAPS